MSDLLKRVWDFVTSRNVAIVLLIIVTGMLAVGALLPNPAFLTPEQQIEMHFKHPVLSWLGERYNSQTLASGNIFGFIGIFLILSTALCSIDRLITKRRAKAGAIFSFPFSTDQEGEKEYYENIDTAKMEDFSREWFKKQKWDIAVQENDSNKMIVGCRGKAGFWGSIFFHFILITALIGLVIYYFGAYRATLAFTEGQSYRLHKDNLVHIVKEPVWGLNLPDAEVGLIKQYSIYPESDPWNATEHIAVFKVREGKGGNTWEKSVRINEPLVIDGKKFLLQRGGFSPKIIIKDSVNNIIFEKFVALKDSGGTGDSFSVQGEDLNLEINFYPDFIMKDNKPDTGSYQVKNPFFMLRVFRAETLLFKGLVPFNGEAEAAGYKISFPEVRRWVEMELVGEPGLGFFFLISFVGLIGVFVRIIDPDERIYIILKGVRSGVDVTSYTYSKHFSGLIKDKREEMVSYLKERTGFEDSRGQGFK